MPGRRTESRKPHTPHDPNRFPHSRFASDGLIETAHRAHPSRIHLRETIHLASVLTIALMCAQIAAASDIAFFIGMWNPGWYGEEQFAHVETIIENTGHRFKDIQKFDDAQLEDFGVWAETNMSDGELDIIWLNGQMPGVLYPFPNKMPDDSLAELWLDNGNMFINVGDPFGYVSHECAEGCPECDARCPENGYAGGANILDLHEGVIDGTSRTMKKTATAETYMPSLRPVMITQRPIDVTEVTSPWEVAAAFGSDSGEDPGRFTDPAVIHNTLTDGYLTIINQHSNGLWIDRPAAVSEFINLWVPRNAIGFAVEPMGKLAMTWGQLKS